MVMEPSFYTSIPKFQLEAISLSKCITSQQLSLKLPTFLYYQYDLRHVDLSQNNFSEIVPTWSLENNKKLEVLILRGNSFKGPLSLSSAPNYNVSLIDISQNKLQDLSNNQFYGKVPEELIAKVSLTILRLSNNNLSGNVVPAVLNVNWLHGKLPRWIENALFLERLALSNDGFEGSIPMEFCKLNRLEFLDLSQNHLFGSIPSCFHPPNIEHVHLYENRLRGLLLLAFYNSSSLVTLDLRGNNLAGNIPKWIDTLSSLSVLLLKDNHFHGKVLIQLCKLHSLSIIDLSQNMFSGPIPSCLRNLSFPMQTKKILEILFYRPSIEEDEPTRIMIGNLEMDSYYPVSYLEEIIEFTTKSGFYSYKGNIISYIIGIDLSCNNLTGHILPKLGNLSEIHSLNLSHNKLIGVIPSSFSKL
ncbi:hypothetical protein ERO13_D02G072850v2 [Gossypium hirsutum]|nr:hypothetical protein ERO13_D02G072850v2 [Gossypium hirsutum]